MGPEHPSLRPFAPAGEGAVIARVAALLAEALSPDDGRAAKAGRLMGGLCRWLDADGWLWLRAGRDAGGGCVPLDLLRGGSVGPRPAAAHLDRWLGNDGPAPELAALRRLLACGRHVTAARRDLVGDGEWGRPIHRAHARRVGHEAHLWSARPLDGGGVSAAILCRRSGRPEFGPDEARLAHALLGACVPLHAIGLRPALAAAHAGLTPRQRAVLALLLEGLTVPQVADRLCLSPHTAKDHVKAIYRGLGVRTRAALLRQIFAPAAQNPPNVGWPDPRPAVTIRHRPLLKDRP